VALQFQLSGGPLASPRGDELGGAHIGQPSPLAAAHWPEQVIRARLLGSDAEAVREIWRGAGDGHGGVSEGIAWQRRGDCLFGVIEIDEAGFAASAGRTPLEAASAEAYARIFRLLDAQGLPQLWRVWNYLADINGHSHGLERYRQFNIGRQEGFRAAQRGVSGNVPAACAIGLRGGPLSVAFLAGAVAAVPVENPRQLSAYDYPPDYGPRSPTFSRGVLVSPPGQMILFISGTASILGHKTVHPEDVAWQSRESMANIEAVVAEANRLSGEGPFGLGGLAYRVYVRNAEDFPAVRDTLIPLTEGARDIVFMQADICRADLLLEIEATASHRLENA
jgi:chorismate lyase / 3-hydroxybenzoate synthase